MFDTNVRMEGLAAERLSEGTRQRLLQVSERLFAAKGFKAVTVREITASAGVHLSAVNYHFGSKEGLYLEVFRERFLARARLIRQDLKKRLQEASDSKEGVIKAFSEAIILGPMTEEERIIHYQLLVRELTEPTRAFGLILNSGIRPLLKMIKKALRPYLPELDESRFWLAILSIFAQIIHFHFARQQVIALLGHNYDQDFKEALIDHITRFSAKGLEGFS
ncbi:CerR family C-terminal domain-containing protein [Thermosulfuriphilus sp.]